MEQPNGAENGLILPEQTSREPLDRTPVAWVKTHLSVIEQAMEEVRQELAKQWPSKLAEFSEGNIPDDSLLPKYRRLSEMTGLCVAWDDIGDIENKYHLRLPEGFSIVHGSARTTNPSSPWGHHTFLQRIEPDGGKTFLGLTEAQFMQPKTSAQSVDEEGRPQVVRIEPYRGQKMSMLLERASTNGRPDLYTRVNRQVAVMYGRESEIKQCLGIEFSTEQPTSLNLK